MSGRDVLVLVGLGVGLAGLWAATGTRADFPQLDRYEMDMSGDFRSYYWPNASRAGERLARGEWPLWDPQHGLGGPFLATVQTGVLYPPNWLHALLPAQTAFVVLAGVHLALAVVLAGGLGGALGAGAWGRALSGVAYASSLQMAVHIWLPPLQYAATWAPGVLWAVERTAAQPSPRRAVALAAALALPLLAGWPYIAAMCGLAALLYGEAGVVARAGAARAVPWPAIAALAAAALGAAWLAAPLLLPAYELLQRSCRALGTLVEAQAVFVGRPHDPAVFWEFLARRGLNDAVPGVAVLGLAAAALGLPGAGRARSAGLLAIGLLGLLASFPNHLPVYGWLRELPLLGDFRFPYRYRLLPALALAAAAGVGLDRLQARLSPRVATACGVLALAAVLATQSLPTFRLVSPFSRTPPAPVRLHEELAALGVERQPGGFGRVYWVDRGEKLDDAVAGFTVQDLEPFTLARTAELITFFEHGVPSRLRRPARQRGDRIAAPFSGHLSMPRDGARARILDLMGVDTVVDAHPPAWLERRYRRVSAAGAVPAVFENPHALPRAYRVHHALRAPASLPRALRLLVSSAFDPRRSVLLDDVPASPRLRSGVGGGAVEIARYEPERVRLRTRGDAPGVVVLLDAHYPGWRARLDGEPVPLLRANLHFRAVAVPAGEHEIELRYAPRSWRLGGGLGLAALAVGLGLAWADPMSRRG